MVPPQGPIPRFHPRVPPHGPTQGPTPWSHPRISDPGSHPRVSVPLFRYAYVRMYNQILLHKQCQIKQETLRVVTIAMTCSTLASIWKFQYIRKPVYEGVHLTLPPHIISFQLKSRSMFTSRVRRSEFKTKQKKPKET